jgi:hypothetical protein
MKRLWTPIYEEFEEEQICRIQLSQGLLAVISAKHIAVVQRYTWFAQRDLTTYYAVTNLKRVAGRRKALKLHQLIWELMGKSPCSVDHKSGDGLDCRDCNLRPGPYKLNAANRKKRVDGITSQYKGVSWYAKLSKWKVQIQANGRKKHLGYFVSEELAARAYDAEALVAFGEYARLNFQQAA